MITLGSRSHDLSDPLLWKPLAGGAVAWLFLLVKIMIQLTAIPVGLT